MNLYLLRVVHCALESEQADGDCRRIQPDLSILVLFLLCLVVVMMMMCGFIALQDSLIVYADASARSQFKTSSQEHSRNEIDTINTASKKNPKQADTKQRVQS